MKERRIICSPADCISPLYRYRNMRQEHFGAIFLNTQKEVIQIKDFFKGSDCICHVYPKLIFWQACKKEASGMILFHNHPSGIETPSEYDINLTNDFIKGGELLGIQILDHIIVSKNGNYSFKEHDLIGGEKDKPKVAAD